MRKDGRMSTQMRPMRFTPGFSKHPAGSVLVEAGNTVVLCNITVEEGVPGWMRHLRNRKGWMTAEYCMIPSATHSRNKRERNYVSGRSQEIQRLVGRSLRGVLDLSKCPDITFVLDCEVLQADGGTRTAAITGGWVALKLAIDKGLREGKISESPITDTVAAVSVGLKNNELFVDLDYVEDSTADLDMNIVMTQSGKLQEVQGTAEGLGFSVAQMNEILEAAQGSISNIFELQQRAAEEGGVVEG